jgi:hypothetical protein
VRTRSKLPSVWLSAAISRSPCSTLMPTCVWLSAAVENTCDFFVGMVVFLQQPAAASLHLTSLGSLLPLKHPASTWCTSAAVNMQQCGSCTRS